MIKLSIILFFICSLCIQVICQPSNDPCGFEDPVNELPWMQNLIDSLSNELGYFSSACKCNSTIVQYCLDNEVYFDTTPLNMRCSDYQSYVYDVNGELICTKGGIAGGDCFSILPGYWNTAELINVVWSCNDNCGCSEALLLFPVCGSDGNSYRNECYATCAGISIEKDGACDESLCNDFAFMNTAIRCEPDCGYFLEFQLTGGDGNYIVENGGVIVNDGDPVVYIWPANDTANLTAVDGNGCVAEVAIPAEACSVAPRLNADTEPECIGNGLFTIGVSVSGIMGNYQINSIGEEVIGTSGELVYITLNSSTFVGRVEIVNMENGCTTNASLSLQNPNCSDAATPQTGIFYCTE